ncbi:collagen-like protein [Mucilaginibacter lappiensis]|uniref:Collagen triple helix repeat-containing protein n=1 Tax=Mucilaginibacter lappiensis TaxID=354630 RepID=A0A841JNZ4_9SPHI|nr:collagen-like protein [Mucilaginibacter lappiensis]MBB6131326.1 hypothetical protein [Mucilaginibacter lappiensis]
MDLIKIHDLPQGAAIADGNELPVSTGPNPGDVKRFSMAILKAWIIGFVTPLFAGITQGPAGPAGAPGAQGIQGQKGDKGDQGDKGVQGIKGDNGPVGPIGIQGPKGDKGDKGDQGAQGVQGLKGPQGPQGNPGVDGAIIVAGAQVLHGAVDPTTEGVDDDFYINTTTNVIWGPKSAGVWPVAGVSIIGPQGPQGLQGPQGDTGTQGPQGIQGTKGDKGDTGTTGDPGAAGPKGDKGDQGSSGPTGAAGPKGDKGDQGDPGPAGAAGAIGPAGQGLPIGGTAGQVLSKTDNGDYNTQWVNPPAGVVKASSAEINAGTDDAKFSTAAGLAGSKYLDQSGSKIYVVADGTDTYTGNVEPAITAYRTGAKYLIKFTNANTGAATLNLNGLGAIPIVKNVSRALAANDISAGAAISLMYDGNLPAFQIIGTYPQTIPPVSSGERIVTVKPDGVHTDYTFQDQIPSASGITGADWSTGTATVSGLPGQFTYDSNYRYDCIAADTWKRSPFLGGTVVDEFLADISDSGGDKTSTQLNTAYPSAVIGQKVWGDNNLYIKKTPTVWRKIAAPLA